MTNIHNNILLLLQGIIDIPKEISKLNGKKDTLSGQLQKLKDTTAKEDYTTKVPEDVQQKNSQKVNIQFI